MINSQVLTESPAGIGPAHEETDAKLMVLVVDDSIIDRRVASRTVENTGRFRAVCANNGLEALRAIEKQRPAVVLTDMQMPEMGGLELVRKISSEFPLVPVILMTATGSEEIAHQALRAGAAGYVPKCTLPRDLPETLAQVVAAAQVDQQRQRVLSALTRRESHYRLENDPTLIPAMVALLQEDLAGLELGDAADRIRVGMALQAALHNALFHGNLEIDSKLREERDDGPCHQLARQRRQLLPYIRRRIHVYVNLIPNEITYVIRDEGHGYDISKLPKPTDHEQLGQAGGRGLLLISNFMDQATLSGNGSQITMTKRKNAKPAGVS